MLYRSVDSGSDVQQNSMGSVTDMAVGSGAHKFNFQAGQL